jgi:hypothetical protein
MDNKKITLILLLLYFFSPQVRAQDMNSLCKNRYIKFNNGNRSHFDMIVHCPYKKYKDEKSLPKMVKDRNKKYLLSRVGRTFLRKVKVEACYVIDFNNIELIKHPNWLDQADKKVKYAFEYSFNIQGKLKYYFTTVYDSLGNLISPNQVPNFHGNEDLTKFISVCKAIGIAETDTVFNKPILQISMEYSNTHNTFVWEIEMNPLRGKNNLTLEDRYILVNANTGNILEHRTQKVISVQNESVQK